MADDRSRSPRQVVRDTASRALELRPLGVSGLQCTSLGFGSAPLGNLFKPIPDGQALEAVHGARSLGVNYFDTAPWYGLGLSESRVGFALRSHARSDYRLTTKIGRTLVPVTSRDIGGDGWPWGLPFDVKFDYSYDGILQQHRESLHRLGHGRVDCLVIHDMEEAEVKAPEGASIRNQLKRGIRALEELRSNKVIHAFGAGLNSAEGRPENAYREWNRNYLDFLIDCATVGERPLDFFLMAGNHTLLNHSAYSDGLLDTCKKHGIGIVIGGAFNSGVLATGAIPGAKYDYEDASDEILDRVRSLESVCKEHNVPLPSAALQYPLGHPNVASVIAGATSEAEVRRAKESMETAIPQAFWQQLLDDGLLPKGAPVPKDP